jgi:CheY-like chemotaxis protein
MSEAANKTVLIADDDADFLSVLARRCKALGLRVQTAGDGIAALTRIIADEPDLLLLDIDMPAGDGLGIAEKLLSDPRIRPVPVVFCTGRSDAGTIKRCQALGAHYVTKGADTWADLKPIVCRLLSIEGDAIPAADTTSEPVVGAIDPQPPAGSAAPPKVLFVDDDADLRRAMQIRLRACGVDVLMASTAMQALWIAMKEVPKVIITDYRMPEGSGEYLLARLRAVPLLRDMPVIVLTGVGGGTTRDYALERRFLGEHRATAFMTKPVDFGALLEILSRYIPIDSEVWRKAAKLRGG